MKNKGLLFLVIIFVAFSHVSSACIIFTASSENVVLAANNEDMCTTNTLIQINPPSEGKYGCIFWGFKGDENFQGGMNEHGLFFDGAGTPQVEMSGWNLPEYHNRYIFEVVLEQCKTVDEAIALVQDYSMPYLKYCHILVADETGDAAIFEWGNNHMNYLRKEKGNFLVATNFNISETKEPGRECFRYAEAIRMLSENEPSVLLFEEILSVTHAEGDFPTVYSNICDLKNRTMYLYNFHNFIFRKEFNLAEEFKKGRQQYLVRSFFPVTNSEQLFRYHTDCIDNFEDLPVHSVTFKVNVHKPLYGSSVYIRGSAKELGSWDETGIRMDNVTDNNFEKLIEIKEGKLFGFVVATENEEYEPVGVLREKLSETIIDVKSDTVIVINVHQWLKSE